MDVEVKGSSASSCAHPSRVALPTYLQQHLYLRTTLLTYDNQYLHDALPTDRNSIPYLQPCLSTTIPTHNTLFYLLTKIPVYNNIHLNQSQLTTLQGTPTTAAECCATTLNIISMPSLPKYYHNTPTIYHQTTCYHNTSNILPKHYHNDITMISRYIQFYHYYYGHGHGHGRCHGRGHARDTTTATATATATATSTATLNNPPW
jgi:hypothetical protein